VIFTNMIKNIIIRIYRFRIYPRFHCVVIYTETRDHRWELETWPWTAHILSSTYGVRPKRRALLPAAPSQATAENKEPKINSRPGRVHWAWCPARKFSWIELRHRGWTNSI